MSLPNGYTPDQHKEQCLIDMREAMQAYGQQCRAEALEEAASLAATTCHHEATPFADGFNLAAINIEKMIRSLKS